MVLTSMRNYLFGIDSLFTFGFMDKTMRTPCRTTKQRLDCLSSPSLRSGFRGLSRQKAGTLFRSKTTSANKLLRRCAAIAQPEKSPDSLTGTRQDLNISGQWLLACASEISTVIALAIQVSQSATQQGSYCSSKAAGILRLPRCSSKTHCSANSPCFTPRQRPAHNRRQVLNTPCITVSSAHGCRVDFFRP